MYVCMTFFWGGTTCSVLTWDGHLGVPHCNTLFLTPEISRDFRTCVPLSAVGHTQRPPSSRPFHVHFHPRASG
ncbi:hypothetical protein F5X98DRAFT_343099 [Xylaria grammica]|nr:hypothetical protein F5X98DRAFT_343099 [Xylaria grammica]